MGSFSLFSGRYFGVTVFFLALLTVGSELEGASLRGSMPSVLRQERVARQHDYTHLRNAAHVRKFVDLGLLVRVRGNRNYRVAGASFPYARPEVKLFLERLSRQYRSGCGEQLVVTSLTRPLSHQPRNASDHSVHPTGMAVDIRKSNKRSCQRWLEETLLILEERGVLEATEEHTPPHYHVALFPQPYARYVAKKLGRIPHVEYTVQRGDTLWQIARRHRTSVPKLKALNGMKRPDIYAGQTLKVPAAR